MLSSSFSGISSKFETVAHIKTIVTNDFRILFYNTIKTSDEKLSFTFIAEFLAIHYTLSVMSTVTIVENNYHSEGGLCNESVTSATN